MVDAVRPALQSWRSPIRQALLRSMLTYKQTAVTMRQPTLLRQDCLGRRRDCPLPTTRQRRFEPGDTCSSRRISGRKRYCATIFAAFRLVRLRKALHAVDIDRRWITTCHTSCATTRSETTSKARFSGSMPSWSWISSTHSS